MLNTNRLFFCIVTVLCVADEIKQDACYFTIVYCCGI